MKASTVGLDIHERIDELEARFETEEPRVMAFLPEDDRFGRLRAQADALLQRYPSSAARPALFGELAGVKDIFQVDGFTTRAGSALPTEELQGPEAESVSRLKGAGALIVGKTVTTEFAYFSPGPTRNPHNLAHTPGGSSSGSAAAVAAGLATLALGTQTIGSIIRPASFCGVVGLKPSYDRISRSGVIPLAPSLDHVGFFSRTVAEARRIASVLYKDWHKRPPARARPGLGIPFSAYLLNIDEVGLVHFAAVCRLLAGAGYAIRPVIVMRDFEKIRARQNLILSAEAARVHAAWFAKYSTRYALKTAELIRSGQHITEAELLDALQGQKALTAEFQAAMATHDIDLWIAPATVGSAPRGLESTGDPAMNLPWTQAGMPAINLPSGKSGTGLPMGLQVIAAPGQDEALLDWAEEIERTLSPG
jgi:Asp-tRNA(Asn)/Glu-tRNA(Gln) amidotransferase A subunit family amidase